MTVRYVCWQPLLTDHQAHTYAALAKAVDGRLSINIGRTHDAVRSAQGWTATAGTTVDQQLIPEIGWQQWARAELERHPDAVHLFGSPFEQTRQIRIMAMACAMGCKVALISEPFSTSSAGTLTDGGRLRGWLKARLRPLLYRGYGLYFGRRLHAVFGISPLACDQYHAFGVPKRRIFPFGYFVPQQASPIETSPTINAEAPLRLVFVGALIARKGLTTAVEAVQQLRSEGINVTLDVYGAGDPSEFPLGNGATYKGVVPFGRAGATIADYHALVLPSLFDGWAVVVNEALQAGTPVACSDAVGAGAVVRTFAAGATFAPGNAAMLAAVLRQWTTNRHSLAEARRGALDAAPRLAPDIAAHYLHQAIAALGGDGDRPDAIWYDWPRDENI
jgi:glycosyltransferase involved in cell wall biosynthesis